MSLSRSQLNNIYIYIIFRSGVQGVSEKRHTGRLSSCQGPYLRCIQQHFSACDMFNNILQLSVFSRTPDARTCRQKKTI